MNYLKVNLWGDELGRLVWDPSCRRTYFMFNPKASGRPDVSPLANPAASWIADIPIFGDSRRIYQGLPPFIADSLPDSWGNRLFDQWARQARISRSKITPLFKLMFIGRRGMGALEFEPAAAELEHAYPVNIDKLYDLSVKILEERESVVIDASDDLSMKALLAAGTSAGGRQMKAIIAMNATTGQIRSGQTDVLDGFDYYIIKFEDKEVPTTEIEMSYYDMATACGIEMEECRVIEVEGVSHFMTRRFDRRNGEKVHMQTLAAINPEADSYEELMETCRKLELSDRELTEVFRRLVFNVLGGNTDDHNKNFSFMLEKGGSWRLAPAYDLTFIFNRFGTDAEPDHELSIYGKTSDITKEDLMEFAKEHGIRDAETVINEVAHAVAGFPALADKYRIPTRWRHIIRKTLRENLTRVGYLETPVTETRFTDSIGREIRNISVSNNTRGNYHITALVNDCPRKRVVGPKAGAYARLQQYELGNLDRLEFRSLIENLFAD